MTTKTTNNGLFIFVEEFIMALRILLVLVAATMITMTGCTKKSEPAAPAEVKVTEENLDSELDKMEKQIEADIAAE
jgi:hypothetical protein